MGRDSISNDRSVELRTLRRARLSTHAGVGHLPPIEATERFNGEVVEFLEERS
jgi:hypothetical protein